jgi:cell division protein FtsL
MTDWADGIETRNYGIRSEIDASVLSELLRNIIPLVMVAVALLFYAWVRSQIVSTGYESQSLYSKEQNLLKDQKRLDVEAEWLKNPRNIETIARNELGMTLLRPNQFIPPPSQDVENGLSGTLAMVDSEAPLLRVSEARTSKFIPAN